MFDQVKLTKKSAPPYDLKGIIYGNDSGKGMFLFLLLHHDLLPTASPLRLHIAPIKLIKKLS